MTEKQEKRSVIICLVRLAQHIPNITENDWDFSCNDCLMLVGWLLV